MRSSRMSYLFHVERNRRSMRKIRKVGLFENDIFSVQLNSISPNSGASDASCSALDAPLFELMEWEWNRFARVPYSGSELHRE